MKHILSQLHFRVLLPLLATAVLLTLPSTATGSKYVWDYTIGITLKVTNNENVNIGGITPGGTNSENTTTSLRPAGYPSSFWVQELTNIQATPAPEGLVLTAAAGYTLPESLTVKIGKMTVCVKTDGTDAPEGITFDGKTGLLSIAAHWMEENPGGVTVSAVAVQQPASAESTPPPEELPAPESTPAAEATPQPEEPPAPESTPAAETTPQPEASPAAESTPAPEEPSAPESTPAAEAAPQPEDSPAAESTPAPEQLSAAEEAPAAGDAAGCAEDAPAEPAS